MVERERLIMYTIVGQCPKCGAPIYVESPWWGVTPPPNKYSCSCGIALQPKIIISDNTTGTEVK